MTLDASYRHCRTIARRHGTTFFIATALLPAGRRRHVHALYALARTADDLVDEPGDDPAGDLERLAERFGEAVTHEAGPEEPGEDPVVAAVADTVRRFDIPHEVFDRFFASMRQDLSVHAYERWDDLVGYMDGSAAAIGEMLLPLLDPVDRDAAREPARALGVALQLTNFLRDVDEDLRRGRQYLPQEDLRRFGVVLTDRRCDDAFAALMRFEIARCRTCYDQADDGIAMLPRRTRVAIAAARSMYAAILDEIEASDYDVFGRRATVPTVKRLRLAVTEATRLWR